MQRAEGGFWCGCGWVEAKAPLIKSGFAKDIKSGFVKGTASAVP